MNGWGKGISEIENLKTYHASEKHKSFGEKSLEINKQTDKQTEKQTDEKTDRQTNSWPDYNRDNNNFGEKKKSNPRK